MIGKLKDLTFNGDGTQNITVTVGANFREMYDKLKDADVTVDIKKASKKRSLTANNFCWALCSDIGKAMTPPEAKEDIYRKAIKAVGVFTPYPLKNEDVETVIKRWERNGEGWFIEVVDNSKLDGYKLIHMYYGTSTYTADEMKVLIDWLVDQAEQMQIPIPLGKKEQERLLGQWAIKQTQTAKTVENKESEG